MMIAAGAARDVAALSTALRYETTHAIYQVDPDKFVEVVTQIAPRLLILDTRPFEDNYDNIRQLPSSGNPDTTGTSVVSAPEPGSATMLTVGAGFVLGWRRRRRG
jgi:hypothetical protein